MKSRHAGMALVVVGVVAYLAGFVVDHVVDYESANASTQRWIEWSWDASLLVPLVAVAVAVSLWPRWRVVLGIAVVMFVVPVGVYEVGIPAGFEEPLDAGCDPCIDTSFLSVMAFPALVIGLVSLAVARFRYRRARTLRRGARPPGAETSSSAP